MSTEPSTRDRMVESIADILGVLSAEIEDDHRFNQDLKADQLDVLEIIMLVEEDFEIEISDDEVESVTTVGNMLTLIEGKLASD